MPELTEPTSSNAETLLCTYLVYALAPAGMGFKEADDAFNDYLRDPRRGIVAHHDHFLDRPGAFAALEVSTAEQREALREPGPLAGWEIAAHPLKFSPTAAGFWVQGDSTLRRFSGMHVEQGDPAAETLGHGYQVVPGGRVP